MHSAHSCLEGDNESADWVAVVVIASHRTDCKRGVIRTSDMELRGVRMEHRKQSQGNKITATQSVRDRVNDQIVVMILSQ